jgi:DNA-binding Lrp family transcriptional regulator
MQNDITPTVAAIGQLHFEGNIIPHTWYKAITFPNGKADVNAILILAEIVYWYRPTIERDESTGEIVSIRKKFKGDMLQRHYDAFAELLGLTKRQCQDAVARLIEQGLIHRELRTVDTPQGRLANVPFFEPVAEAIQRVTYHVITGHLPRSNGIALTPHGKTYTKITAKTSAKKEKRPPSRARKGKYSDQPNDDDPERRKQYSRYNR